MYYSLGMLAKVVDYQTDRVVVPGVGTGWSTRGTGWSTRGPGTGLPTFTRLLGHRVMRSGVCGVVKGGRV